MISTRKVIMVAGALMALVAGLSWNGGNVITKGAFSEAQARVVAVRNLQRRLRRSSPSDYEEGQHPEKPNLS